MRTAIQLQFHQWLCTLEVHHYQVGDRLALRLLDATTGAPVAMATLNNPAIDLDPDELLIKDYSENEGMLDTLLAAALVHPPHRYAISGYAQVPVVRLTVEARLAMGEEDAVGEDYTPPRLTKYGPLPGRPSQA